jgi:homoserine O-acetyltransferase
MDGHDIGRGRGGVRRALRRLAATDVALTGIGIQDDILYGPRQVRALVDAATEAGVRATYREIRSTKGHDAFLVEWAQLTDLLREALVG